MKIPLISLVNIIINFKLTEVHLRNKNIMQRNYMYAVKCKPSPSTRNYFSYSYICKPFSKLNLNFPKVLGTCVECLTIYKHGCATVYNNQLFNVSPYSP